MKNIRQIPGCRTAGLGNGWLLCERESPRDATWAFQVGIGTDGKGDGRRINAHGFSFCLNIGMPEADDDCHDVIIDDVEPQRTPDDSLGVGDSVQIEGLTGKPEHNGKRAQVVAKLDNGRFRVAVQAQLEALQLDLRPQNLSKPGHISADEINAVRLGQADFTLVDRFWG